MVAFATVGISFLFRPLGAFLAGHYGDKLGRRAVLIVLRIIQGLSAGGEWGGAVLLAVEHAEPRHRGLRGSFPQIGVSVGLILSSGPIALMTAIAPGEAFLEWGWRVPFFLSILLVAVGYWIRRGVEESPVFHEIAERKEQVANPLGKLFKSHWRLHPELRHRPWRPGRARARPSALGGVRLGSVVADLHDRGRLRLGQDRINPRWPSIWPS